MENIVCPVDELVSTSVANSIEKKYLRTKMKKKIDAPVTKFNSNILVSTVIVLKKSIEQCASRKIQR